MKNKRKIAIKPIILYILLLTYTHMGVYAFSWALDGDYMFTLHPGRNLDWTLIVLGAIGLLIIVSIFYSDFKQLKKSFQRGEMQEEEYKAAHKSHKTISTFMIVICLVVSISPLGVQLVQMSRDGEFFQEYYLGYEVNEDGETCTITYSEILPWVKEFHIPEEVDGYRVTTIGASAFQSCSNLTSVTIPNSVTTIGAAAFQDCSNLASVTIPDSVTGIDNSAFDNCHPDLYKEYQQGTYIGDDDNPYKVLLKVTSKDLDRCTIHPQTKIVVSNVFENCENLKSIEIPSSVTAIGWSAFYGCDNLAAVYIHDIAAWCNISFESDYSNPLHYADNLYLMKEGSAELIKDIIIPDSVTSIGDYAFCDFAPLTSITIPASVTGIGNNAFSGCNKLTDVYIYDIAAWCNISFESDYSNPLYYADNLYLMKEGSAELIKDLVIPDSVSKIGDYAFCNYNHLKSITVPDSVTIIGDFAFYSCYDLANVTIGGSVTDIGEAAFQYCSNLTSVTIPHSVTAIGVAAFASCDKLESITIDENNTAYQSINGNLYTKDGTKLVAYAVGKQDKDFIVPNSVTGIADSAFEGCDRLTSVTIGESVTTIGESAFGFCSKLTSVTIPDSVTTIGDLAFINCYKLTNVTIPASLTVLNRKVFYGCEGLTSIIIPNSVTTIGESAFEDCVNLTSVIIGDSVTTIGDYAFLNCESLASITIPNAVTIIGAGAFALCSNLASITINDSVTTIGDSAFYFCTNLNNVYYTNSKNKWEKIAIDWGNSELTNATIHYNYAPEE